MLNTVIEASQNFCTHQIRTSPVLSNKLTQAETYIAYIDITTNDGQIYRVYIASNKSFMQRVSTLFLEEDESDDETLIDMTLETANLIIGSAKVIAEERNDNPYVIGTPYFEKYAPFDFEYDEVQLLSDGLDELILAIKEQS